MKAIVYTILFEGALRVKSHNNYLLSSSFLHSIVYHSTQAMIQSKLWSFEWNPKEWAFNSNESYSGELCCGMSRYWTRGKFGEHKRGVRAARGAAESNSSLLSALQTSQVLNISTYTQLKHELIIL